MACQAAAYLREVPWAGFSPGVEKRYLAIIPMRPPEMRELILVRMRGSAIPAGEATYRGSHTGSNLALYWRNPWKV